MTQRLLIIIGLFCLFSVAQAQELSHPFTDDVLAEGVTVLEVFEPVYEQPPNPIEQSGDWRIRESETGHQLCNITSDDCTDNLSIFSLYGGEYGPPYPDCDATWDEDGFIAESPDGEWVIFSDCGSDTVPASFYNLFSYNLQNNQIYHLGSPGLTHIIQIERWLNETTPLLTSGLFTGTPILSRALVNADDSFEIIAGRYFLDSDNNNVYWSEYKVSDSPPLDVIGWQIYERNLVTDEINLVFNYNYPEPRSSEQLQIYVMAITHNWIIVTDSHRLSAELILYIYDRQSDNVVFVSDRLGWLSENWAIGYETGTFWHWEYTFDGENATTNFTLIRSDISPQSVIETEIITTENIFFTYLSPDERYLLLASANGVQIYDINTDEMIPVTINTEDLCRNCTIYGEWLPDYTIQLRMETYYSNNSPDVTVHINIDALSEANS